MSEMEEWGEEGFASFSSSIVKDIYHTLPYIRYPNTLPKYRVGKS